MANIAVALSLALSYLSVHIAPDTITLPAFFGLLYPYLLLLNIIMVIVWAVNLSGYSAISLAVIIAGLTHHGNYIQLFDSSNPESGSQLTIITYNVELFNHYEGAGTNTTEHYISSIIEEEMPDIISFQEYYVVGPESDTEALIKEAMGGNASSHIKLLGKGRERYYGIATFSTHPIINRGEIIHPNSASLTIYSDIVIADDTIRVFNNHLQSFMLNPIEHTFIEELSARGEDAISEVRGVLGALGSEYRKRALQARVVRAFIDQSPYPVIVLGDFNDTPVSYAYRTIRGSLKDSFVSAGYGAGFTYRGPYPSNRIDYILHDKRFRTLNSSVIRRGISDHYPLKTSLSLSD